VNYQVLSRINGVYYTDHCEGWSSTVATMTVRRGQGEIIDVEAVGDD
jgi:hypothetical protein